MTWLITGLLVVIAGLLWLVTGQLEKGFSLIAELIRASGQTNERALDEKA